MEEGGGVEVEERGLEKEGGVLYCEHRIAMKKNILFLLSQNFN